MAIFSYLWFNRSSSVTVNAYTKEKAESFFESLVFQNDEPQTDTLLIEGTKWNVMSENASSLLLYNAELGTIAVKEKGNGDTLWLSTPGKTDLEKEKVVGTWRGNLNSPFIFTFAQENTTIERLGNTVDNKATIDWRPIKDGVGVRYEIKDIGFTFYLEYTLVDKGFRVHMPPLGVLETLDNKLITLELLPFFAAAMSDVDGYILVPDGPGGLIEFHNTNRVTGVQAYSYPVYGTDWSVPQQNEQYNRSPISYPVFGMKRADVGFIAIIEEGAFKANIVASPAGLNTAFNRADSQFQLRRKYERPTSLTSQTVTFEKELMLEPLSVRYLFAPQGQSDYVGLAATYRSYLMNEKGVSKLNEKEGKPPLQLHVILAANEPTPTGDKLVTATTLEQAGDIVADLLKNGVDEMVVSLNGWQNGGYPGRLPARFPIESDIGGNKGFEQLQSDLKKLGIPLYLDDQYQFATDKTGNHYTPLLDSVRQISGLQLKFEQDGDWYSKLPFFHVVSPGIMHDRHLKEALEQYKNLNIAGANLIGLGNNVYSDFHASHTFTRQQAADENVKMMDDTRKELGYAATTGGFAYALGHVDHLSTLALSHNYDFIIDRQVPFYPIAIHGLVTYTYTDGNNRIDPEIDFLRGIEYGAQLSYAVTHENPGILQRTNYSYLFSSQYDVLKKQIVEEYKEYAQASNGIWTAFITDHREVMKGVFETTYENGRKVMVNYNDYPVNAEAHTIAALSFNVVAEGVNP